MEVSVSMGITDIKAEGAIGNVQISTWRLLGVPSLPH